MTTKQFLKKTPSSNFWGKMSFKEGVQKAKNSRYLFLNIRKKGLKLFSFGYSYCAFNIDHKNVLPNNLKWNIKRNVQQYGYEKQNIVATWITINVLETIYSPLDQDCQSWYYIQQKENTTLNLGRPSRIHVNKNRLVLSVLPFWAP